MSIREKFDQYLHATKEGRQQSKSGALGYDESEWDGYRAGYLQALEDAAREADHFQKISTTPGHACGEYIAAVIRALKGEG